MSAFSVVIPVGYRALHGQPVLHGDHNFQFAAFAGQLRRLHGLPVQVIVYPEVYGQALVGDPLVVDVAFPQQIAVPEHHILLLDGLRLGSHVADLPVAAVILDHPCRFAVATVDPVHDTLLHNIALGVEEHVDSLVFVGQGFAALRRCGARFGPVFFRCILDCLTALLPAVKINQGAARQQAGQHDKEQRLDYPFNYFH